MLSLVEWLVVAYVRLIFGLLKIGLIIAVIVGSIAFLAGVFSGV